METAAINTAIRVLDFCSQRNTFARKYSLLIKELQSQLDRGFSSAEQVSMTPTSSSISSASLYTNLQIMDTEYIFARFYIARRVTRTSGFEQQSLYHP